jgi:hypothetical protein
MLKCRPVLDSQCSNELLNFVIRFYISGQHRQYICVKQGEPVCLIFLKHERRLITNIMLSLQNDNVQSAKRKHPSTKKQSHKLAKGGSTKLLPSKADALQNTKRGLEERLLEKTNLKNNEVSYFLHCTTHGTNLLRFTIFVLFFL